MNNLELAKKHKEVAEKYKTIYMWGCFGMPVTEQIIQEKTKQYPNWYNANRQYMYRNCIGKNVFGFDCVNLTKGILWGWNGDTTKRYGGAKYASNGVPDTTADGMIANCREVKTTDWKNMMIGEGLWLPGHWGLYIGDGLAVECTPAWKNCVQITAVGNIGTKPGYNTRTWQKHGKLPYVTYVNSADNIPDKNGQIIVNNKTYPIDRVLVSGTNYVKVRDFVDVLREADVCDLEVGFKGNIATLTSKK